MNHRPKYKAKIIQLLEDDIGENLYERGKRFDSTHKKNTN